jgi:hypothetical protein
VSVLCPLSSPEGERRGVAPTARPPHFVEMTDSETSESLLYSSLTLIYRLSVVKNRIYKALFDMRYVVHIVNVFDRRPPPSLVPPQARIVHCSTRQPSTIFVEERLPF